MVILLVKFMDGLDLQLSAGSPGSHLPGCPGSPAVGPEGRRDRYRLLDAVSFRSSPTATFSTCISKRSCVRVVLYLEKKHRIKQNMNSLNKQTSDS